MMIEGCKFTALLVGHSPFAIIAVANNDLFHRHTDRKNQQGLEDTINFGVNPMFHDAIVLVD